MIQWLRIRMGVFIAVFLFAVPPAVTAQETEVFRETFENFDPARSTRITPIGRTTSVPPTRSVARID